MATAPLAVGTLVTWHEIGGESGRVVLVFDVETLAGNAFRGIADESLTVTALVRLAPGQQYAVRYRPEAMDHYVAWDPSISAEEKQALVEAARKARRG